MPWAINPIFEPSSPTERATTDVEVAGVDGEIDDASGSTSPEPKASHASKFRPPSDHFTPRQLFYIFGIDGIGSAILAGLINFAIAYALYHDKGTEDSPIRLFQFPNTVAGDAAVTIFIQFVTTWVVQAFLVNYDLKRGGVQPIGFLPEPQWKYFRWFMCLDRQEQTDEVRSVMHWLRFLFSQVIRSLILAAIFFPFIFGASVGFLTLVGRHQRTDDWDWYFKSRWAPEIFKLVQGAVLGLLFTPPTAIFWLAKCGWALRTMESQPDS
ncbi:hypothetical protein F4803DRAFT_111704 [Xylaria telfairii]|nr:hypothetical protein F4803DRAFT_111704 [Xylaria telfairii]